MQVTLAEMLNSGGMKPEEITFSSQTGPPVEGWDTNPSTKFLTQNCSCLKEIQGQNGADDGGIVDQ